MNITLTIFFAAILTLVVLYILYPLNAGAISLVYVLSLGLVALTKYIYKSITRKKEK